MFFGTHGTSSTPRTGTRSRLRREEGEVNRQRPMRSREHRGRSDCLPDSVVRRLQPYFAHDLRRLRIRQGIPWYVVSRHFMSIRAFTHGDEIYFAPGAYDPHSSAGLILIAHEALHAQQYAETGPWRFRARYAGEYLRNLWQCLRRRKPLKEAYRQISFERRAREHENRVGQTVAISSSLPPRRGLSSPCWRTAF